MWKIGLYFILIPMYKILESPSASACVLAALYLRGAPRPFDTPVRAWRCVASALRQSACDLECAGAALRREGLWAEATCLETPGLLSWAWCRIEAGAVLTAEDSNYPRSWLRKLGGSAPPALWKRGEVPSGPFLTIVGSRNANGPTRRFAAACGSEALALGFSVASGGAAGCDRAAANAVKSCGGALLEILPHGLNSGAEGLRESSCHVSLCEPCASFSAAAAMERNALLYALGDAAVVVQAHYRQGGSWTGATDALRRRLTRVIVWEREGDLAARSLVALGAVPLKSPSSLSSALAEPLPQEALAIAR